MNYYCPFCDQRCYKLTWDSEWINCDACKIRYHEITTDYIIFTVRDKEKVYEFHTGPRTTAVSELTEITPGGYGIDHVVDRTIFKLDRPIKGVTPDNALEKLKTLLVFS